MSFWLLIGVTTGGFVLFLLLLAGIYPGNGSDLLDWDPGGRAAKKILAEEEDIQQMREVHEEHLRLEAEREARRDDTA